MMDFHLYIHTCSDVSFIQQLICVPASLRQWVVVIVQVELIVTHFGCIQYMHKLFFVYNFAIYL